VALPDHWAGYRLVPQTVELWQGRRDRLHDRVRYRREAQRWVVERLAP
jgi:pyridoxamine 5'-phosphate oxidase